MTLKLEVPMFPDTPPEALEAVSKSLKQALAHPLVQTVREAAANAGYVVSSVHVGESATAFFWPNPRAFSAVERDGSNNTIECYQCGGDGLDRAHQWPDGSCAHCELCSGYGSIQVKANS